MKKVIEFFKTKKVRTTAVLIFILVVAIILAIVFIYNGKAKVDTQYLVSVLENSSELTTAKLNYTGLSEYEDTGIPIINKSNFIMVYTATARIGIDVQKIEINKSDFNKTVYVTFPEAEVFDVKVDTSSIKYFDESFALLNVNEKEDSNMAIKLAEDAAKEEVKNIGVLEMANTQAETLIKGLLNDAVPTNYKLEIIKK